MNDRGILELSSLMMGRCDSIRLDAMGKWFVDLR